MVSGLFFSQKITVFPRKGKKLLFIDFSKKKLEKSMTFQKETKKFRNIWICLKIQLEM